MRLELTGRNVAITPGLRQMLNRRLSRLDRLLNDSAVSAQVVLTLEKYRHLTDVTVHARGDHMLTGQGSATTWPLSMKQATERIEQQAQRVKEKWQSRKRRAPGRRGLEPATAPSAPADVAETLPRVVRVRHIARPMDVETAAARLDASGDPFILFRNDTSGRTAVLVRRKDGSLGLIEPGA
jgi:putative sigma-54 modulation protein